MSFGRPGAVENAAITGSRIDSHSVGEGGIEAVARTLLRRRIPALPARPG